MFAFVVLVFVSLILTQDVGCEERLQSDLFCVKCDVKLFSQYLNNSINIFIHSTSIILGLHY